MMKINQYLETKSVEDGEEAVFLVEEAMESRRDVEYYLDDLEGLSDTYRGLTSLEEIASSIESATVKDLYFLETGVNLALGRYGGVSSEILPSLESNVGKEISLESFKNVLEEVYKAIVKTIERIWESIKNFFKKLLDSSARLEGLNQRLRERLDGYGDAVIGERQTELGEEIKSLTTDNGVPKEGKDIVEGLRNLNQLTNVLTNEYTKMVIEAGDAISKEMDNFDPEKPEESLHSLNKAAEKFDLKRVNNMVGVQALKGNDPRWKRETVNVSAPMLGEHSLFTVCPRMPSEDSNVLAISEMHRQKKVLFDWSKGKKAQRREDGKIKTIQVRDAHEIVRENEQAIKMIKEASRHDKALESTKRSLTKSVEKLKKRFDKETDLPTSSRSYMEAAMGFASAYANWMARPRMDLIRQLMSSTRASITAVNKSLKNYDK